MAATSNIYLLRRFKNIKLSVFLLLRIFLATHEYGYVLHSKKNTYMVLN